jgi:replicative DNA helicase
MSVNTSMQENLLMLLCFDTETVRIINSNITPEMFDNKFYRVIAEKASNFFIKFQVPIGEHLADELEKELQNEKTGELYAEIIYSLFSAKDSINKTYVLDQLDEFIRGQLLDNDIESAIELRKQGKTVEAEAKLYSSKRKRIEIFKPGAFFGKDLSSIIKALDTIKENSFLTGIEYLDKLGHVPTRKEMWSLVGRPGRGKSWALVYLGKKLSMQRLKVLHLTLENSEERTQLRYAMSYFGIGSKTEDLQFRNCIFKVDEYGKFVGLDVKTIGDVPLLTDTSIKEVLVNRLKDLYGNYLLIKWFPSGTLTMDGLKAYLDNLETYHNWIPDVILLDYLGLMKVNVEKLRLDLGILGVELRGLAGERNLALVTVHQTNRAGEDVSTITRKHLGEDFSPVRTSDVLLTGNQTEFEKQNGLYRMYIDKGRNGRDGDTIILSQNISIGQFCLKSALLSKRYWEFVSEKEKE